MDPCPFVRLIIESLSLKLPTATKPAGPGVHPSTTPCYAKLKFSNFPSQTALLPLCSAALPKDDDSSPSDSFASAEAFHLDPSALRRLSEKPAALKLSVFAGRMGQTCGITSGKLLGVVQVAVDLSGAQSKPVLFQSGWKKLGGGGSDNKPMLHVVVRSEPDPRFVFQFGGEPECSPVVFQIQGSIRQPVFSCKFSADRNNRTRCSCIYDHPVRSIPAWLILRPNGPSVSSWKPWGRLEAWRERGPVDGLGYKFELVTDAGFTSGIPIAEGAMNVKKGGRFCIDNARKQSASSSLSPVRGFVMCSSVEGKNGFLSVQVAVNHVNCMADAALFVALSAAIDLSMDACQLFSRKLRKEFCHDENDSYS
nr:uncharacterized protein LOC109193052 [Ipomoea batatas]